MDAGSCRRPIQELRRAVWPARLVRATGEYHQHGVEDENEAEEDGHLPYTTLGDEHRLHNSIRKAF